MNQGNEHVLLSADGILPGAKRDAQSITSDWEPLQDLIHDVELRDVRNVLKNNGVLTEIYRRDWGFANQTVDQVFQVMLEPGAVSAWHTHQNTTDRLFCTYGRIRIVLYDAREGSPTRGVVNVFHSGSERPQLMVLPPGIWHGVQNIGSGPAMLINLVDRAYSYEMPDHWRLPQNSPQIPYSFSAAGTQSEIGKDAEDGKGSL